MGMSLLAVASAEGLTGLNTNFYPSFDEFGVYQFGSLNSGDTAWMLAATGNFLYSSSVLSSH